MRHVPLSRSLLGTLLVACALCWPGVARAALPITFDGLSNGTAVSNQFSSDGVVFVGQPESTGLPVVKDVGALASSGGNVAISTCSGCEFVENVIRGQLSQTRETVSMRVGIDGMTDGGTPIHVQLQALDAAKAPIATATVAISSSGFSTPMTVNPPGTDNIAYFDVRTTDGFGASIGIDDLSFAGAGTGAPDVSVSSGSTDVRLLLGGSVDVPVTVSRFNGSSGNVTLSAGGLPGGVTATFTPSVLTGTTTTATLHLAAAVNATASFTPVPLAITATPADSLVAPGPRVLTDNLTVEAPFYLTFSPNPIRVPSCGSGVGNLIVNRVAGFTGTVSLAIDPPSPGYSASLSTTSVPTEGGNLSTAVPLTVSFAGSGGLSASSLTVHATSAGSPAAAATVPLQRFAGELTGFQPATGRAPRDLIAGDQVTLAGSGFCPGSVVRFDNAYATVTPTPGGFTPGGSSLVVTVPRFATTGPITVVSPDGNFSSPSAFTVRDYRNTAGFAFDNYDHPGVSISDLQDVYGESQTNITLDLCWPFGCNVVTPLVSPFTYLYKTISNELLSGNGSCFGISLMSQRLAEGYARYSSFTPAGATASWQLDGPTAPGSALAGEIRGWHSAQLSSEFIQYWTATAATNAATRGSSTRSTLESQLRSGHHPLIVVRNSTSQGHVLVVSDVRDDTTAGSYLIDVNDPNLPFLAGENADGALHHDRVEAGVIHVAANGHWTNVGAYGSTWSGGPGTLVAVPWGTVPARPTLPTTLSGFLSLILPIADRGAQSTQVTDARGRTLLSSTGDLNTNTRTAIPGSNVLAGITGSTTSPLYVVPARGNYTQTLRGTGHGSTGASILAPGFAGQVDGVRTAKGKASSITLTPFSGRLSVTSTVGGARHAQLARQTRDGAYGADVRLAGSASGRESFALDPRAGTFSFRNGNRVTHATVTLSWGGRNGTPGTVRLGRITVPAGATTTVTPRSWRDLTGSASVIRLRNAHGRLLSTRIVRPRRATHRVRGLTVVAARTAASVRRFTIKASFRRVPRSARVLVVLDVLRGHRLAATRMLRLSGSRAHGTRSFGFRLRLARGTYSVRGSVIVSTSGAVPSIERPSRSIRFRAR